MKKFHYKAPTDDRVTLPEIFEKREPVGSFWIRPGSLTKTGTHNAIKFIKNLNKNSEYGILFNKPKNFVGLIHKDNLGYYQYSNYESRPQSIIEIPTVFYSGENSVDISLLEHFINPLKREDIYLLPYYYYFYVFIKSSISSNFDSLYIFNIEILTPFQKIKYFLRKYQKSE